MKPSEPMRYKYIMEKNGKTEEFEQYPSDTTYKFKEMVLLNENAKPKITDYRVWSDAEGDFTPKTFEGNNLFIIVKDVKSFDSGSIPGIRALVKGLKGSNITPYILTSASDEEIKAFKNEFQLDVPDYKADATVLKTIMRSNPGTWLLSNGVVKGKWHSNTTPDADEVKNLIN